MIRFRHEKTERGFSYTEFSDRYGTKCSVSESSLATEACIWLGVDDPEPKIMASAANRLGLPTGGETVGWVKYDLPKEVLVTTRMHLTKSHVADLIPVLQFFLLNDRLPSEGDLL